MSETTEADFVLVTTATRRKRHWAWADLTKWTLCGHSAHDQPYVDRLVSWTGRSVLIFDLPQCKVCDKSRQRQLDGRPS